MLNKTKTFAEIHNWVGKEASIIVGSQKEKIAKNDCDSYLRFTTHDSIKMGNIVWMILTRDMQNINRGKL